MTRTRTARRGGDYGTFCPVYVDVLSTLLLVFTFLLSIFMLAQYFVSQESSGKDTALRRLNQQIAELTNLLSLAQSKSKESADQIAALTATLETLRAENARRVPALPKSMAVGSAEPGRTSSSSRPSTRRVALPA